METWENLQARLFHLGWLGEELPGFVARGRAGGALVLGLAVAVVTERCDPDAASAGDRRPSAASLDVPGAVLGTVSLAALIYGVSGAETAGWASTRTLVSIVVAVVLAVAFLAVESRSAAPLAPLWVLARRSVWGSNLAGMVTFAGAVGLIFTLTLYIQQVWAFNPLFAGLSFVLMGLASILARQVAPRLIVRTSSRTILVVGLLIQAVGTAVLVGLSATPSTLVVFLVGTAVAGFGHITSVVSFRSVAASGLPDQEQGLAAGLATTAQQVGAALGVAIFVAVSAAGSDGLRRLGVNPGQAQAVGTHDAVIVCAALLAAAALVAVVTLPRPGTEGPRRRARRSLGLGKPGRGPSQVSTAREN